MTEHRRGQRADARRDRAALAVARVGRAVDGPDFHWQRYPGPEQEAWERRLVAEVESVGLNVALSRFDTAIVMACEQARACLVAEGIAKESFLVVPLDDDGDLTRRVLTPTQLARHFPELAGE